MREAAFIRKNRTKWQDIEEMLNKHNTADPDQLAHYFIELNDDLSYAQTWFPQSSNTQYLNQLAARTHHNIYKNKNESKSRLVSFWKYELPELYYKHRKQILISFLIFSLSMGIGALSAAHDDTFVRLIMGDAYVNKTLENIEKGDPMAIYKSQPGSLMFLGITTNNIRVSFYAFAAGVLFSFGTGMILFQNGVMLGAFQYFFYQKGLLATSALTIWIHGTLEISAIIIAGAAGLTMGNSILFPGTLPRMASFKKGARSGIKMVTGLVPVFIAAGFLESYITRQTDWPDLIKIMIIGTSAAFILWYFIIFPSKIAKGTTQ